MSDSELARLQLLPVRLRLLCCLFLVFLAAPLLFLLPIPGGSWHGEFYGLSYVGSPWAPQALALAFVLLLHGVAAYGLLWSKSWGPALGIAVCGLGLAAALYTLLAYGLSSAGPGPIVTIFVLATLLRVRRRWAEIGRPRPPPCGEDA